MPGLEHDDEKPLKHQDGPLRDDSEELLAAVRDLRATEERKRQERPTSPKFHELARQVEAKAREVFRVSAKERRHGEQAADDEREERSN